MTALKIIVKILLLPLWLLLGLCWLLVHIVLSICSIFHGFITLLFGAVAALSFFFGMWHNAVFFIVAIAAAYIILLAGSFIDLMLEETRKLIGRLILA